ALSWKERGQESSGLVTQQRTLCYSLLQGNLTSLPVPGVESDPDGATGSAGPSLLPSAPGLCSMWILLLAHNSIGQLWPKAFACLGFLEKIDLSHNLLAQLPPDFSDELASLKELKAAYNRLSAVGYESLQHLESLEKLDLSYNQVASIEKGAFRGLSRLRYLYLQSNRLGIVHNGFFSMLQNLEVLFLGTNNISAIELEAFTSLHNVNLLALTGNQLLHLKFKTFLNIQTPSTHLQLAGNPWACDCDLQRVFSKILSVRHLHVEDYANITCASPWQLAGLPLVSVDAHELGMEGGGPDARSAVLSPSSALCWPVGVWGQCCLVGRAGLGAAAATLGCSLQRPVQWVGSC
uniref:LRRCT domain-containing protein n=1 Tax=Chrysemys picta bellii TaxID=8478 RepID=A0A8C3IVA2_CHRPI